jgi:hypothetical protein
MSEEELISAYSEGRVSRRMFIRRLVAAGVSASAALAYASTLAPSGSAAASPKPPTFPILHI